jgi:hypothetical protein
LPLKNYKNRKPKSNVKWDHYHKFNHQKDKSFDELLQDFMEKSRETQRTLKID